MTDVVRLNPTAAQWWVQIRGHSHGPYSIEQMARFMSEGRVRPSTLVADNPETGWIEARKIMSLRGLRTPAANDSAQAANVFVHAEIFSGATMAFLASLEGMGAVCDLAPNLWMVRTKNSAGVIRNALSQTLEIGDRLVVIDATRDRLAWFNLGPETDARINKVWNSAPRPEPVRV